MMYNPYNWEIRTNDGKIFLKNKRVYCSGKSETPKPQLVYNCILDDLGNTGNELDAARMRLSELESKAAGIQEDIKRCNEDILRLEQKKVYLINKLAETP